MTYSGCTSPVLSTAFSTVAGTTYQLSFSATGIINDSIWTITDNSNLNYSNNQNGRYTAAFVSNTTGTDTIYFDLRSYTVDATWTLDDISIRESPSITPALRVTGYDGLTWLSLG